MVRPELKSATRLRRKDSVPPGERTPDREQLADWIEEHVIDGDEVWYNWTMTEIADATGYSRTHVSNTLDAYFEPATNDDRGAVLGRLADELGETAAEGDYHAGFVDGFERGIRFAREHPDLFD